MKPPRIKKNIEETEIANESAKKIPQDISVTEVITRQTMILWHRPHFRLTNLSIACQQSLLIDKRDINLNLRR